MGARGLEPPWISPYAPEAYASANFATRPFASRPASAFTIVQITKMGKIFIFFKNKKGAGIETVPPTTILPTLLLTSPRSKQMNDCNNGRVNLATLHVRSAYA